MRSLYYDSTLWGYKNELKSCQKYSLLHDSHFGNFAFLHDGSFEIWHPFA